MRLDEHSQRGRQAADSLDLALRDEERRVLEGELERRRAAAAAAPDPGALSADLARIRLEREVELLRGQRAAVEASRVWRAAQFFRRLVGRAW